MDLVIAVPGPPKRGTGGGPSRAPWPYWRLPECGASLVRRRHREGLVCARPGHCWANGCPSCYPLRRSASLSGLDLVRPRRGRAIYMATLTPGVGRVRTYADRDQFLDDVRALLGAWKAAGVIEGGVVVVEAVRAKRRAAVPGGSRWVPSGELSDELCPGLRGWWRGWGDDVEATGRAWSEACLDDKCPMCDGGVLLAPHLHAHVWIVAERPFWYGEGPSRYPTIYRDFAHPLTGERVGARSYATALGFRVIDFKPAKKPGREDADALGEFRDYMGKVFKDYMGDVAGKHGEAAGEGVVDAMLIGAWMAGRRSVWSFGCVSGLASASSRSLSWSTLDVGQVSKAGYEGPAPNERPPEEGIITRRNTLAWRHVARALTAADLARVEAGEIHPAYSPWRRDENGEIVDAAPRVHPLEFRLGVKWVATSRVGVTRAGTTHPALVIGGCVAGPVHRTGIAYPSAVLSAVARSWRRWVNGDGPAEWCDVWDRELAPALGLPSAPLGWYPDDVEPERVEEIVGHVDEVEVEAEVESGAAQLDAFGAQHEVIGDGHEVKRVRRRRRREVRLRIRRGGRPPWWARAREWGICGLAGVELASSGRVSRASVERKARDAAARMLYAATGRPSWLAIRDFDPKEHPDQRRQRLVDAAHALARMPYVRPEGRWTRAPTRAEREAAAREAAREAARY